MADQEVFNQIASEGIVPVVTIQSPEQALPLADALIAGGLSVIEITFRTEAAPEAIQLIAEQRPQLMVGAGTILSIENAQVDFNGSEYFTDGYVNVAWLSGVPISQLETKSLDWDNPPFR